MLPFGKDNLNMAAGARSLLTLFLASMVFMGFLINQDIHCIMVFINTIATIVQYQFIFCNIAEVNAVEEEAREIEMQEFNEQ
ncbi:unnamed protein product [Adineta steineri]|uniref:Uncharacterized protein n=1 Tax=Adineta steineri TaxID=433720 RepID=A0A818JNZ0_9BILA|nr:unnamed protein product [Adineta steineri]